GVERGWETQPSADRLLTSQQQGRIADRPRLAILRHHGMPRLYFRLADIKASSARAVTEKHDLFLRRTSVAQTYVIQPATSRRSRNQLGGGLHQAVYLANPVFPPLFVRLGISLLRYFVDHRIKIL